jgi:hypothetical protein
MVESANLVGLTCRKITPVIFGGKLMMTLAPDDDGIVGRAPKSLVLSHCNNGLYVT